MERCVDKICTFFNFGEVLMLSALMWIARCAWMRALMNLQSFVELGKLSLNGLQEQWEVLFPLRRPWLPDYLCSNLPYYKFKNFLRRGPQSMLNT
ncbi:hypothetical protein OIU77_000626 [Salix suchowensis]|uniref:Uncharacterized protein n=1 Tax=Salix suchowensis TaxID=1278906 RepID=A0ABQ9B9K0_9ROSI|nr:hypothetical protein OIU77_000626 [Salix suchowensis]